MPNTREKLIAVFEESDKKCLNTPCDKCEYFDLKRDCTRMMEVDHLIANGVTVQKWIPVTERLPEPFVLVLVQMPDEKPFKTVREGFISKDGIWHSALYYREPGEVTHWMPLPEAPKGE